MPPLTWHIRLIPQWYAYNKNSALQQTARWKMYQLNNSTLLHNNWTKGKANYYIYVNAKVFTIFWTDEIDTDLLSFRGLRHLNLLWPASTLQQHQVTGKPTRGCLLKINILYPLKPGSVFNLHNGERSVFWFNKVILEKYMLSERKQRQHNICWETGFHLSFCRKTTVLSVFPMIRET